jgi:histone-lysine N-methyltransferase SETMAR
MLLQMPEKIEVTWCQDHTHSLTASLQQFGREHLKHPPYSPDFAPTDFHLFGPLKKHLGGHRFQDVVEVQQAVSQWFHLQSPEFCTEAKIH